MDGITEAYVAKIQAELDEVMEANIELEFDLCQAEETIRILTGLLRLAKQDVTIVDFLAEVEVAYPIS